MSEVTKNTGRDATIDYLQQHGIIALSSIDDHAYYDRLLRWQAEAEGAFSRKTWLSIQYDWKIFLEFCRKNQLSPLPAKPSTIRHFILSHIKYATHEDPEIEQNIKLIETELAQANIARASNPRSPSTISRYISTISAAHRGADAPNPALIEGVKLALKKARRVASQKQTQAESIHFSDMEKIRKLPKCSLRELSDMVIASIAFDTGLRRHRIARISISDLVILKDGNALIEVERDKTDREPKYKPISAQSLSLANEWIERSGITNGPLLRAVKGNHTSSTLGSSAISGDAIQSAMKRCMKRIGASPDRIKKISGHSCRIGGAQYLRENDMSTTEIMHYGDWKTPIMPLRYTKHLDASKSGMARLFAP